MAFVQFQRSSQKNSNAAGFDRFGDPHPPLEAKEVERPWNRERSLSQAPLP